MIVLHRMHHVESIHIHACGLGHRSWQHAAVGSDFVIVMMSDASYHTPTALGRVPQQELIPCKCPPCAMCCSRMFVNTCREFTLHISRYMHHWLLCTSEVVWRTDFEGLQSLGCSFPPTKLVSSSCKLHDTPLSASCMLFLCRALQLARIIIVTSYIFNTYAPSYTFYFNW